MCPLTYLHNRALFWIEETEAHNRPLCLTERGGAVFDQLLDRLVNLDILLGMTGSVNAVHEEAMLDHAWTK